MYESDYGSGDFDSLMVLARDHDAYDMAMAVLETDYARQVARVAAKREDAPSSDILRDANRVRRAARVGDDL